MKRVSFLIILLSLLFINGGFYTPQLSITGAWHEKHGDEEAILICKDGYIVITEFNQVNTSFGYCTGGACREKDDKIIARIDFDNNKSEKDFIGQEKAFSFSISGDKLTVTGGGTTRVLTRIDDGSGTIAGVWRMTGRLNNGQMETIEKGPQKTVTILSGKRFQWISFNTETKEFIGSGGGHYSFKEGKYTEDIEYFAKDPDKIGTSVSFDASVNKNTLTNKGKNNKGEPVQEEWTRIRN